MLLQIKRKTVGRLVEELHIDIAKEKKKVDRYG